MSAPDAQPRRTTRRALLAAGLGGLGIAAAGLALHPGVPGGRGAPGAARPQPTRRGIDTLSFFLKRYPQSLTGTHLLAQSVDLDGRRSLYLKGDSSRYEAHAWDDDAIYQVLDRDPERTYRLTPGLWLARRMLIGEEFLVTGSTIAWYDRSCRERSSEPYRYTIKLEQHRPNFDAGGDLGRQDVIIVRYLPDGGRAERFYYSREWGWIGWEDYIGDDLRHRSWFNRIVPQAITPTVTQGCAALLERAP